MGLKGAAVRVFDRQGTDALSDETIDCRAANAVNVQCIAGGASPSATVSVEGSNERGANYLPLYDPNASQDIAANAMFECVVGTSWARIRLASVSGLWAVIVTPFVAPSHYRPRVTVG